VGGGIGSIEKISDAKDVLEELLKDFETLNWQMQLVY